MSFRNYLQGIGSAVLGRPSVSAARMLRYHAGENNKNRKNVTPDSRTEDGFWADDYEVHSARAREQLRNFALLPWMIDKHLDFVATFDVEFSTGIASLDDWLEELYEWWSKAENFDAGKRYSLFQYLRVNEAQKILNGDTGTLKFEDGRVMAIDSDQIGNGYGRHAENWFRGVYVNPVTLEPLKYRVLRRNIQDGSVSNDFFDVAAHNFYLHAERKHYPNLIRGISPIACSINSIQDCYEGIDWHLVKMKIAAMFGLVTFSKRNLFPQTHIDPMTGEKVTPKPKPEVKLGEGVKSFNLDETDKVEVLESKIPSTESQEFYKVVTLVAIKSLNIPYSFFSENFTNFYGSRGAMLHYIRSCEAPRRGNTAFLDHLLKWRITKWITDGYIKLPRGYDVRRIRWQCVPRGIPIWDIAKDTAGAKEAITGGLTSPQRVAAENGTNFYKNIDETKEALEYAKAVGVSVDWSPKYAPEKEKDEEDLGDATTK